MATVPDIARQAIKDAGERLEKTSTREHAPELRARDPRLLKSIQEGTLTPGEIDAFLREAVDLPPKLKQYLLGRKAWLLMRGGEAEQALHYYDEALRVDPASPSTWLMKGSALLELDRTNEAFEAFQQAYSLRDRFGPQRQEYLRDLFLGWSLVGLLRGLFGILHNDAGELQKGVEAYLEALENSRKEEIAGAIGVLEAHESASQELKDALEELDLAIRLLSIKDPFEGLRALSKEVSKYWPKGLSAVDAVREQRDRKWNT